GPAPAAGAPGVPPSSVPAPGSADPWSHEKPSHEEPSRDAPAPEEPIPTAGPPADQAIPAPAWVGDGPPTYDPEPTALPAAHPDALEELVADTVLDGARYGTYTLRAASVRGDSPRFRGEPRRDALLTARFGTGAGALLLVAIATGARAVGGAHRAAAEACHWTAVSVGRSHSRLSDDIRGDRRGDLKSGLHRLTDRTYGKLRSRATALGVEPGEYTASLRCLLLSADPGCRTRVFFGVGPGGLVRLREGAWEDLEPPDLGPAAAVTRASVAGSASGPAETPQGDRLTMDFGIPTPPSPYVEAQVPPPPEPFRFRASVAQPGDTLLLCGPGLADPLRAEPALAAELARRWSPQEPPGLAEYLTDVQLRVKGYADDRTAVTVWEA
ncbi:protein phosphatase 2C domain-containing protein, partial [Streptomyces sp. 150FB]|uniref:protein phosphatase 2C domain-containing protein n=1 Tax=Streptomyces sp. 150FB TaxID=1576605 RepID=UPI001F31470B